MPHKAEILRAADRLVAAQMRSLNIGGLQDQTITDRESPGEEILEDELFLESQPPLSNTREIDA